MTARRALQGDSLDISFVLIIILSLVGSRHVIFFNKVPNSLKLFPAVTMFKMYFSLLPWTRNMGRVLSSSVTTFKLGNSTGVLAGLSRKDSVYLLIWWLA